MYSISLWMGCATPMVQPVTTPVQTVTTQKEVIHSIDLQEDFAEKGQGWHYQLERWSIVEGQSIPFTQEAGWVVVSDTKSGQTVLDSGMYPKQSPVDTCRVGCTMLVVQILSAEPSMDTIPFAEQELTMDAPTQSNGVNLVGTWSHPLTEFSVSNKQLRFRHVRVDAAGIVGQHKHQSRPSFACLLSGEVVEHRGEGSVNHRPPDCVAERNGLVHWWENQETSAELIVFDIIDL